MEALITIYFVSLFIPMETEDVNAYLRSLLAIPSTARLGRSARLNANNLKWKALVSNMEQIINYANVDSQCIDKAKLVQEYAMQQYAKSGEPLATRKGKIVIKHRALTMNKQQRIQYPIFVYLKDYVNTGRICGYFQKDHPHSFTKANCEYYEELSPDHGHPIYCRYTPRVEVLDRILEMDPKDIIATIESKKVF
jgi:hypothetical protein